MGWDEYGLKKVRVTKFPSQISRSSIYIVPQGRRGVHTSTPSVRQKIPLTSTYCALFARVSLNLTWPTAAHATCHHHPMNSPPATIHSPEDGSRPELWCRDSFLIYVRCAAAFHNNFYNANPAPSCYSTWPRVIKQNPMVSKQNACRQSVKTFVSHSSCSSADAHNYPIIYSLTVH